MTSKQFKKVVKKHTFEGTDIFFKMNALLGELGELSNILKKEEFKKHFKDMPEPSNPVWIKLEEELGDTMFYIYQIINELNFDPEEIMEIQASKLKIQSGEWERKFLK